MIIQYIVYFSILYIYNLFYAFYLIFKIQNIAINYSITYIKSYRILIIDDKKTHGYPGIQQYVYVWG